MTSSFDREKGNAARLDALLDEGRDESVHPSRPNDAYGNQPGDMSSQAPALNDLLNEIAGHIAKSEQDRSLSLEDMQAKLSEIAEHVRGSEPGFSGDMSLQGAAETAQAAPQGTPAGGQENSLLGQIESHIATLASQMNEISTEDEQLQAAEKIKTQLAALTEHFAHSDMQFAEQGMTQAAQRPNVSSDDINSDHLAEPGHGVSDEGLISYKVVGEQNSEDKSVDLMRELAPLAHNSAPHVNVLQDVPQKTASSSHMFESEEQANQALAQAYEETDFDKDAFAAKDTLAQDEHYQDKHHQDKTYTVDRPAAHSADVFANIKEDNSSAQIGLSQNAEPELPKQDVAATAAEEVPDAAALYSASVVSDEPEIPEALARALEARAAKAEAKQSHDFMSLKPRRSSSADQAPEPETKEVSAARPAQSGLDNLVANFGQQLETRPNLSGPSSPAAPAVTREESRIERRAEQSVSNTRGEESGTYDNIQALEQKISQIAAHISSSQEHGKKIDKIETNLGALIERIETSELYLSKVASQAVDQAAGEFMNKLDAKLQSFAPQAGANNTDHAVLEAIQTTLSEMSRRLDRLEQTHSSSRSPMPSKMHAEPAERQAAPQSPAPAERAAPAQHQEPILKQQPNFLAQQKSEPPHLRSGQHTEAAPSDEALSAHKNDFVRAARNAAALASGTPTMNERGEASSPPKSAAQNMAHKVKQASLKPGKNAQSLVARFKKKAAALKTLGPFRRLNIQPLLIGTAIIGMIIGGGYIANLMQSNLIEENGQNRSAHTIPPPPQGITPLPKMQRDDTNINAPLQGHRHRYGAHPPQTHENLKQSQNEAPAPMVNRVSKLTHNGAPQMTENAAKDKGKLPPGMAIGRASDPNIRRTLWSTARRRHIEKTLVGASKYHDIASPALGRVPVKISDQPASVQKRHIAKMGQSISGKKYISSASAHKSNQYAKIAKYRPNSARFAVAKVGQRTQAVSQTPAQLQTRLSNAAQKRALAQPVKQKAKRLDQASLSVAPPKVAPAANTARQQTLQMPPLAVGPNSLRLAAAKGHAAAQFEVANRLMSARSGRRDYRQAVQWYKRAAAQSHAPAQYRLGAIYERGKGVKRDLSRARAWYRRAAQLGNIKAMHNLAVLYTGRSGLAPDYATAAQWFLEAAKYGLADSQYNLGILLKNGLGVKKDFSQAYKWFTLAAIQGDKPSLKQRKLITQNITPEEIARLDQSTLNWHAEPEIVAANDTRPPRGGWQKMVSQTTGQTIGQTEGQNHVSNAAHSTDVTQTQYLLQKLGYNVGSINGQLNDKTRKAIMQFEQRSGLAATGQVSKALLVQLKALAS